MRFWIAFLVICADLAAGDGASVVDPGASANGSETAGEHHPAEDAAQAYTEEQLLEQRRMSEAYRHCAQTVLSQPRPSDGVYCNATFDGWGCWPHTAAGQRAWTSCPPFIVGFDHRLQGFKDCDVDGTWWRHPETGKEWANYTTCVNVGTFQENERNVKVYLIGYSLSIAAVTVSLVIFTVFRNLWCPRVSIHKHLFFSYILNNTAWILWFELVTFDVYVLKDNHWPCQVLHVLTQYFLACNYFWMFAEGLYLHTVLVVAFVSEKTVMIYLYVIGWGFPLILTAVYGIARGTTLTQRLSCWIFDSDLTWILAGPCVASLIVNFFFLINIIRVLVTKLRAPNTSMDSHDNQAKKAVRATLILVPLFGVQYFLTPFRPEDTASVAHDVYMYASAVFTSFQGLFVAILFCFLNGEVISTIRRKLHDRGLVKMSPQSMGMTSVPTTSHYSR